MFKFGFKLLNLQLVRRCHGVFKLQHGTLHLRFSEYLKESQKLKLSSRLEKMIDLMKVNTQVSIQERNDRCSRIIEEIEKTNLHQSKNPEEIRKLLDLLVEIMPDKIAYVNLFVAGLKRIYNEFESNPNKEKFVKLCFYLGLFKKKHPGQVLLMDLIENHGEKFLNELNTTDLAIVCMATFKAVIHFNKKTFEERLIEEIVNTNKPDNYIFVAFIKSLRLNKVNSHEVLDKLRDLEDKKELSCLDFQALIHVLPYIADNSFRDTSLANALIDRCANTMNETTRAKDVQKLLSSCASLSISVNQDYLEKLNQLVIARTDDQEYKEHFDGFFDIALSMWMLGFKPKQLVEKLLGDSRFHAHGDLKRIKIDSRKKLLTTCLEIEKPEWLSKMKIRKPSFDIDRSAPHYLIRPSLEILKTRMESKKPKIVQQILNLNIAGLTLKENGNLVHIEALDSTNCLSDKKSPNGIFGLKLRLLRQMGCHVIVVSSPPR